MAKKSKELTKEEMMKLYIEEKKEVLKDFLVPENVIDSIPWDSFTSECQIDNHCKPIIYRYL